MSARTDFQIRRQGAGFMVFVTTSWWAENGASGQAGGPACPDPFRTRRAAVAWVREQFSIPADAWARRAGVFCASSGPERPGSLLSKATHVPRRRRKTALSTRAAGA
jgi:hypothetical protein